MAMLLDAFDSSAIKNDEEEEDNELNKQLNNLKESFNKRIDSIKLWFRRKTEAAISPKPSENVPKDLTSS